MKFFELENLSQGASKSPEIVAELAELIYRDEDGNFIEIDNRDIIVSNCITKLHNLKIDFDNETVLKWCEKFLEIMKEKKSNYVPCIRTVISKSRN